MKDSIEIIKNFFRSEQSKNFDCFLKNNLDLKTTCLGINIKKNKITSIKKYAAYKNKNDLITFLKVPFINTMYKNMDNDETTISSPCVSLKYYPKEDKFVKYFHIKFNKEYLLKNKKYFLPKHKPFNLNHLNKVGISIENKKIIKYFYFSMHYELLTYLTKKFNLTNNFPKKIEYVEYKDKFKFILDEDTDYKTFSFNDNIISLIEYIEKNFKLKFKTGGKNSKGQISLYFF